MCTVMYFAVWVLLGPVALEGHSCQQIFEHARKIQIAPVFCKSRLLRLLYAYRSLADCSQSEAKWAIGVKIFEKRPPLRNVLKKHLSLLYIEYLSAKCMFMFYVQTNLVLTRWDWRVLKEMAWRACAPGSIPTIGTSSILHIQYLGLKIAADVIAKICKLNIAAIKGGKVFIHFFLLFLSGKEKQNGRNE